MKCEFCNTKIREDSQFCRKCGNPVNVKNCYIKEMKESEYLLNTEEDKQSLRHIIEMAEQAKMDSTRFLQPVVNDLNTLLKAQSAVRKAGKQMSNTLSVAEQALEIINDETIFN